MTRGGLELFVRSTFQKRGKRLYGFVPAQFHHFMKSLAPQPGGMADGCVNPCGMTQNTKCGQIEVIIVRMRQQHGIDVRQVFAYTSVSVTHSRIPSA